MKVHCRRLLRVIDARVVTRGSVPTRGLLVSNHLSYIDILVLGSRAPTIFLSKSEVARWPVIGWLVRQSGTLFIEREKRADVARVNEETRRVLESGLLLVIFPEGTSSDGREVLPFKSALLEPVISRGHPLTVSHIAYELEEGNPGADICYWGDMTFGSHLLNLLTKRRITAVVDFTPVVESDSSRKELARRLHFEVSRLKASRAVESVL